MWLQLGYCKFLSSSFLLSDPLEIPKGTVLSQWSGFALLYSISGQVFHLERLNMESILYSYYRWACLVRESLIEWIAGFRCDPSYDTYHAFISGRPSFSKRGWFTSVSFWYLYHSKGIFAHVRQETVCPYEMRWSHVADHQGELDFLGSQVTGASTTFASAKRRRLALVSTATLNIDFQTSNQNEPGAIVWICWQIVSCRLSCIRVRIAHVR